MAHVYASLAQFNDYLRDNGSTTHAAESAAMKARKLLTLESTSAKIDDHCNRSLFGSGFGPRIGTNRYDGDGTYILELYDDLLSITSLTIKDTLDAAGTTYTENDDFTTRPYDRTPKRSIDGHGTADSFIFTKATRSVEIVGTWGYQDVRRTASATASAISDTTTTSVTVSAGTEFSPGQTLRIDTEQLYVSGVSGTTLTVVRGVNGTTAATHSGSASIGIYEYPVDVVDACLALAHLRWKWRDSGSDATDGGGEIPIQRRGSERGILLSRLSAFRFILTP